MVNPEANFVAKTNGGVLLALSKNKKRSPHSLENRAKLTRWWNRSSNVAWISR